jgi:hypothetical protein
VRLQQIFLVVIFLASSALPAFAGEWLDEFDKPDLHEEWTKITWRPGDMGSATIEDGMLLINEPGDFGHTITDGRPLVLRSAPKGDFSISTLVDTDPPAPAQDYWVGLFVIGENGDNAVLASNWASLSIGGAINEVKALIGSMIGDTWNDKGHFDIPEWPVYLKLEKVEAQYTGYFKVNAGDDWTKVGATWSHDGMEEPELVGLGFINNWGGRPNLTVTAEYFLLEGDNVIPMAVQPIDSLLATWGQLKEGGILPR